MPSLWPHYTGILMNVLPCIKIVSLPPFASYNFLLLGCQHSGAIFGRCFTKVRCCTGPHPKILPLIENWPQILGFNICHWLCLKYLLPYLPSGLWYSLYNLLSVKTEACFRVPWKKPYLLSLFFCLNICFILYMTQHLKAVEHVFLFSSIIHSQFSSSHLVFTYVLQKMNSWRNQWTLPHSYRIMLITGL